MAKEIIFDGGKVINSTDWAGKSKDIIAKLDAELFGKLNENDSYDIRYSKEGEELSRTKKRVKKGEIMPLISPTKVATYLNRLFRIYKPLSYNEALSIEPEEYIEANLYYLDIISHINDYIIFIPSKQSLSAFLNISVDTYNELLLNPTYSEVFKSFEDGFVDTNYMSAQSGVVDSKTTMAKLSTRDAGHNLVKNVDFVKINVTNKINTSSIDAMYEKFVGVSQKPKQIGKGDKK